MTNTKVTLSNTVIREIGIVADCANSEFDVLIIARCEKRRILDILSTPKLLPPLFTGRVIIDYGLVYGKSPARFIALSIKDGEHVIDKTTTHTVKTRQSSPIRIAANMLIRQHPEEMTHSELTHDQRNSIIWGHPL